MRTVELARSTFLLIREFGLRHALARIFVFARVRWFCFLSIVRYVFRKPAQKTVIRTILGHRMQLHLDDYGIHKELFLYGVHEPKASEHLTNVLPPVMSFWILGPILATTHSLKPVPVGKFTPLSRFERMCSV